MDKVIAFIVIVSIGFLWGTNKLREQELQIKNDLLQQQLEQQTIYFNGYKEGNTAN